MHRALTTSRRTLLTLAGGAVLATTAGCDLGGADGPSSDVPAAGADPDQRLLDAAVDQVRAVRGLVLDTIEQHPGTAEALAGVLACTTAHLEVLGVDPEASATPSGSPSSSPSTSPAPSASEKAALQTVTDALELHARQQLRASVAAESGTFARLLAVLAAGTTQYASTLSAAGARDDA